MKQPTYPAPPGHKKIIRLKKRIKKLERRTRKLTVVTSYFGDLFVRICMADTEARIDGRQALQRGRCQTRSERLAARTKEHCV